MYSVMLGNKSPAHEANLKVSVISMVEFTYESVDVGGGTTTTEGGRERSKFKG